MHINAPIGNEGKMGEEKGRDSVEARGQEKKFADIQNSSYTTGPQLCYNPLEQSNELTTITDTSSVFTEEVLELYSGSS